MILLQKQKGLRMHFQAVPLLSRCPVLDSSHRIQPHSDAKPTKQRGKRLNVTCQQFLL